MEQRCCTIQGGVRSGDLRGTAVPGPGGRTTVQSGALTSPDVRAAEFGALQSPLHHTLLSLFNAITTIT